MLEFVMMDFRSNNPPIIKKQFRINFDPSREPPSADPGQETPAMRRIGSPLWN